MEISCSLALTQRYDIINLGPQFHSFVSGMTHASPNNTNDVIFRCQSIGSLYTVKIKWLLNYWMVWSLKTGGPSWQGCFVELSRAATTKHWYHIWSTYIDMHPIYNEDKVTTEWCGLSRQVVLHDRDALWSSLRLLQQNIDIISDPHISICILHTMKIKWPLNGVVSQDRRSYMTGVLCGAYHIISDPHINVFGMQCALGIWRYLFFKELRKNAP